MRVAARHAVAVAYRLAALDESGPETLLEQTAPEEPFVCLHGTGAFFPPFERELFGRQAGDRFDFRIPAGDAYGERRPEHVLDLPRAAFEDDGGEAPPKAFAVGARVPMLDRDGHRLWGTILAVGAESVRVDLKHPLAGKALDVTGEVVHVRAATLDELERGNADGER